MELIIVSGRSGSGKSTALHVLEDIGFDCIDNLPADLLPELIERTSHSRQASSLKLAVGIDARNLMESLDTLPDMLAPLREQANVCILYLDADDEVLLQRFHATRRRHPLTRQGFSLEAAIQQERKRLDAIASCADHRVDTSGLSLYELRDSVKYIVLGHEEQDLELIIQSFGYKHGIPRDSDFVFDVRCLPNPYWEPSLRPLTGKDKPVQDFLNKHEDTARMVQSIFGFLSDWMPGFRQNNRAYVTISVGCTGGQHRSVYVCEKLAEMFRDTYANVKVRHREQGDT
ncbi:RNase adapter RapZ [Hahella sp. SMD15-11]|uniref:RNase adapter RapZ n=1 Tax=Thermohahella caldifontis TaxID=3142973 RepID=A0AB39UZG2_9GAMM